MVSGRPPPSLGYQSPCWCSHVGSVSSGSQLHFLEAKTLSGPGFKKPIQQRGLTPGPFSLSLGNQNGKQRKFVEQRIQARVTGPPDSTSVLRSTSRAWTGQVQSDQRLGTAGCEGEAGQLPTVCGSLIRLAQRLKNVRLHLFLASKCAKEISRFIILFL